ncbi:MAG: hypothetical protein R3E35_14760 [Rhodocyclaceae bacterium]
MKIVRASSPEDFGAILDYIHDRSYELNRLQFDRDRQELRIPIQLGRKGLEGLLVIRNANAFSVRDDAQIDEGDINTIEYEHALVVIKGAIPVDLTVAVSVLDIELVLPDNAPLA